MTFRMEGRLFLVHSIVLTAGLWIVVGLKHFFAPFLAPFSFV